MPPVVYVIKAMHGCLYHKHAINLMYRQYNEHLNLDTQLAEQNIEQLLLSGFWFASWGA
jgi:hypothetical protein